MILQALGQLHTNANWQAHRFLIFEPERGFSAQAKSKSFEAFGLGISFLTRHLKGKMQSTQRNQGQHRNPPEGIFGSRKIFWGPGGLRTMLDITSARLVFVSFRNEHARAMIEIC